MQVQSQHFYQLTPASKGKRFLAFVIDFLPFVLIGYLIAHLTFHLYDLAAAADAPNATSRDKLLFSFGNWVARMIGYALWIAYCFLLDYSPLQGSIGKRLMGIKVVDLEGRPLGWKQSLVRNLGKWLGLLMFITYLYIFIDKNRQALHDKIAKTLVVGR